MQVFGSLNEAVPLLQAGQVGVLPTDTVYGLAARASDPTAVAALYTAKQREQKPGTVIAATIDQLVELGVQRRYLKAVEQFWPNAISIVIPVDGLDYLDLGKRSLAVRLPKDDALQQLLIQTGPLLTSSANMPGEPPANTVQEAIDYFNDSISFYVDGGDLSGRDSSTVIRMVDDAIEVLRMGAVHINERGEIEQ